jgi:hypothetical protein
LEKFEIYALKSMYIPEPLDHYTIVNDLDHNRHVHHYQNLIDTSIVGELPCPLVPQHYSGRNLLFNLNSQWLFSHCAFPQYPHIPNVSRNIIRLQSNHKLYRDALCEYFCRYHCMEPVELNRVHKYKLPNSQRDSRSVAQRILNRLPSSFLWKY